MNFGYLSNISSSSANRIIMRVVLRRRGRNVLIILGIAAYIVTFFFLQQVLSWLSFSEPMRREALLFAITGVPGFIFMKLSELEIIMTSALWRWNLPRGRQTRCKVKVMASLLAIIITLAISVLQWFRPWPAIGSWQIGIAFSAGQFLVLLTLILARKCNHPPSDKTNTMLC